MASIWSICFHFTFNYLNTRNRYRLFKFWMKLTLELPVKSESDYRVAGLFRKANKKFWESDSHAKKEKQELI